MFISQRGSHVFQASLIPVNKIKNSLEDYSSNRKLCLLFKSDFVYEHQYERKQSFQGAVIYCMISTVLGVGVTHKDDSGWKTLIRITNDEPEKPRLNSLSCKTVRLLF